MNLDLQSLSAEPLVYMLMHSGAFVTVLGITFFLIGLLFGRVTWGRYKRQARELRAEGEGLKEEVANLKRKLADLSVKPGTAAPMVTEMIVMPRKESPGPAPAVATTPPAPAASPELKKSADSGSLPASAAEQPAPAQSHVIKARATAPDAVEAEPPSNGTAAAKASPVAKPEPASASLPGEHTSPLSAIITTPAGSTSPGTSTTSAASSKKDPHAAYSLQKGMLVLPEIPMPEVPSLSDVDSVVPAPALQPQEEVKPEFDPELGVIYRAKPQHTDDLTALKGVAGNLEQRLQTLGVYTYEQIAEWTPDQIREFSARLSFKDRIQREQWVEQARELLASRQGFKASMQTAPAN